MTSAVGGALTFTFDSDSSVSRPGWEATIGISGCPPPPPYLFSSFCSDEMPLEFNPPLVASAGVVVADSGFPNDTGIVGTGLGEYVLENVTINVQGEMAEDVAFYLQPAGTAIQWELGAFAGGTDGMDTAVVIVILSK